MNVSAFPVCTLIRFEHLFSNENMQAQNLYEASGPSSDIGEALNNSNIRVAAISKNQYFSMDQVPVTAFITRLHVSVMHFFKNK